jgi:hypothetical protein
MQEARNLGGLAMFLLADPLVTVPWQNIFSTLDNLLQKQEYICSVDLFYPFLLYRTLTVSRFPFFFEFLHNR